MNNCERCGRISNRLEAHYPNYVKTLLCQTCAYKWLVLWQKNNEPAQENWDILFATFMKFKKEKVMFT